MTTVIRFVRVFLGGFIPGLRGTLNICLPLVAAGYTILNISLAGIRSNGGFVASILANFNATYNFTLTVVVLTNVHRGARGGSFPRTFGNAPSILLATYLVTVTFCNFDSLGWKNTVIDLRGVLVTAKVITTINLVVTVILDVTRGMFRISISRGRITIHRYLTNGGYNTYNCTKYSTLTGTVTRNRTPMGTYPSTNGDNTRTVTGVVKISTNRFIHGATFIHYSNARSGHAGAFGCCNANSYATIGLTLKHNGVSYTCNYVNCNDYTSIYSDGTVEVVGNGTIIRSSLYITYNGYIGTYPRGLVRVIPCSSICEIRYGGHRHNGSIGRGYRTNYVNYNVYREGYPINTVGMASGITRVSCSGYVTYNIYTRGYPSGIVEGCG